MTVSDLFRKFSWDEVRRALAERYPQADAEMLKHTFTAMCDLLETTRSSIEVTGILKDDSTNEIFGVHGGEEYTLHFCTLKEWASMHVRGTLLIKHDLMDILMDILHEMTLSGYSDEEIEASFAEIISRSDDAGCTTEELTVRMQKKFPFLG